MAEQDDLNNDDMARLRQDVIDCIKHADAQCKARNDKYKEETMGAIDRNIQGILNQNKEITTGQQKLHFKIAEMNCSLQEVLIARKQEIQRNCSFLVLREYKSLILQDGTPIQIKHYNEVINKSPYMEIPSGKFTTPVPGNYQFTSWISLEGAGNVSCFLCSNLNLEGEYLGTAIDNNFGGGKVVWQCCTDMQVWIKCVSTGQSVLSVCTFRGELLE